MTSFHVDTRYFYEEYTKHMRDRRIGIARQVQAALSKRIEGGAAELGDDDLPVAPV